MMRFTLPRDLYHGEGAMEALKTLKGKRAMICVGGGSMKRFGFLQKAEDYLKEAGFEVKLYRVRSFRNHRYEGCTGYGRVPA